jgi:hypothetical protein
MIPAMGGGGQQPLDTGRLVYNPAPWLIDTRSHNVACPITKAQMSNKAAIRPTPQTVRVSESADG